MNQEKQLPHDHHENEIAFNFLCANIDHIEDFRIVSDIFKQLGDPTRLRIFWLLCHSDNFPDILPVLLPRSPSLPSSHRQR